MDYGHATGHGVGNQLNTHEGPIMGRIPNALTLSGIEAGMILANEPGYYLEGDFGIRIETYMLSVPSSYPGFVEFETISRLPIDQKLVNRELMSTEELGWLNDYHRVLLDDLNPSLDADSAEWLTRRVAAFISGPMHGRT